MPLYEYECTQCKRHTEKIQKFSDPEITVCPSCGGPLERVISAPAIAFKGGGWYKDGYGNSAPQKPGGSGENAGGSPGPDKSNTDPALQAALAMKPSSPPPAPDPSPSAAPAEKK